MTRQMHLVGYLMAGPSWHNNGSWRHPESDTARTFDPARYEHLAQVMERGCFDGLFFVDVACIFDNYAATFKPMVQWAGQMTMMDPMQLLATMARATKHIGLAATMTTMGNFPYQIARQFATLDHISGGRCGWNVVTSASAAEARNFGLTSMPSKNERYDHADEVLEACYRLWGSWEPGAVLHDQASGIYADPDKVHYVDYEGKYVRSRGPLTTPRGPQGRPVIMQAGSSPRGRAFAGRWAEMIFTHQGERRAAQAFYADIKARVAAHGRKPEHCAILPAIDVIAAETRAEAEDLAAQYDALVNPELGVVEMSLVLGQDLSPYPLDAPAAGIDTSASNVQGVVDNLKNGGAFGELTLREAGRRYGVNQMTPRMIGSPTEIADQLQDMFEAECCDGFMVVPAASPRGYEDFVRLVVPELQRRGLFRKEYTGRTFYENLFGEPVPAF
ncbi:LLM class flavin-dependent oxidoreductase [Zavarzinia sp. CC-PAN008]|uniref:LLM class flavin-dependent oxidoreductase n=1 Tax=Zavarzinia sp. CC-PAN008 TaxID=3243332 RepID=UPI003F745F48